MTPNRATVISWQGQLFYMAHTQDGGSSVIFPLPPKSDPPIIFANLRKLIHISTQDLKLKVNRMLEKSTNS